MVSIRYADACAEIFNILKHMNINEVEKVSYEFIKFIRDNASPNYICKLDYSKELSDMELKKETRELLALMYEKYWCPEEEKEDLQKKFCENEKKYQEELRGKYNPDNLFKKTKGIKENEVQEQSNMVSMIEYKEPLIERIINKIKDFFRK